MSEQQVEMRFVRLHGSLYVYPSRLYVSTSICISVSGSVSPSVLHIHTLTSILTPHTSFRSLTLPSPPSSLHAPSFTLFHPLLTPVPAQPSLISPCLHSPHSLTTLSSPYPPYPHPALSCPHPILTLYPESSKNLRNIPIESVLSPIKVGMEKDDITSVF